VSDQQKNHSDVCYRNRSEVTKFINQCAFHHLNIIKDDLYQVECMKKSVNKTFHSKLLFYGYVKLRSLYMTYSGEIIAGCVKPHMCRGYFDNLHHWLSLHISDKHRPEYVETQ